jgi:signal transduction histidine kinase
MTEAAPGAVRAHDVSRIRGMAGWLPEWMGSLRFRLTIINSLALFALAALVVAGIYASVSRSIGSASMDGQIEFQVDDGEVVVIDEAMPEAIDLERQIDQRTLETLRQYSFGALGLLFISSLFVGWWVAGWLLRPIDRIADAARDIQATDLSRRIALGGPRDELRDLADTFDDMLSRLDAAFEDQRTFIHETSHELRNPLAVMRTNLEVALSDDAASVEDWQETAQVVKHSSERMSRLVDDLLLYARRESRSMVEEQVDLVTVVQETVAEFRTSAENRGISLQAQTGADLWVDGDRVSLARALANLLANATRLAPENSVIRVTAGKESDRVWMAVTDQGPGIAPEDHVKVFQRFWRAERRTRRNEVRSGLGLAIVRQIVEGHGGEVRLASEVGQGSVFSLWLPAASVSRRTTGEHPQVRSDSDSTDTGKLRRTSRRWRRNEAGELEPGDTGQYAALVEVASAAPGGAANLDHIASTSPAAADGSTGS